MLTRRLPTSGKYSLLFVVGVAGGQDDFLSPLDAEACFPFREFDIESLLGSGGIMVSCGVVGEDFSMNPTRSNGLAGSKQPTLVNLGLIGSFGGVVETASSGAGVEKDSRVARDSMNEGINAGNSDDEPTERAGGDKITSPPAESLLKSPFIRTFFSRMDLQLGLFGRVSVPEATAETGTAMFRETGVILNRDDEPKDVDRTCLVGVGGRSPSTTA